jgi:hypothetical protein
VVEDLEHVAAGDRHEEAPRQVAAELVLDLVGRVLEARDLGPVLGDRRRVTGGHRLDQRKHLPRAGSRRLHVLLHGSDRRAAEQAADERHGYDSYGVKSPLKK